MRGALLFFAGVNVGAIVGFVTFCLLSANGRDGDGE